MALAIFDLDNTLIHGDSDYLWGKFLIEQNAVDAEHFEKSNDAFYADYQAGTLDIMAYQRFSLAPLASQPMDTLIAWRKTFMHQYILPIYQDKAQAIVDKHRQQGDQLLIITATNSFVTRPIADLYGIEALIGTDPEIKDNRFTGEVVGTPSFQQGKVTRLEEWLANQQLDLKDSYFYSDSHNDIPLLELVDNPIMVDADEALLSHGQTKQWPATSFRD